MDAPTPSINRNGKGRSKFRRFVKKPKAISKERRAKTKRVSKAKNRRVPLEYEGESLSEEDLIMEEEYYGSMKSSSPELLPEEDFYCCEQRSCYNCYLCPHYCHCEIVHL